MVFPRRDSRMKVPLRLPEIHPFFFDFTRLIYRWQHPIPHETPSPRTKSHCMAAHLHRQLKTNNYTIPRRPSQENLHRILRGQVHLLIAFTRAQLQLKGVLFGKRYAQVSVLRKFVSQSAIGPSFRAIHQRWLLLKRVKKKLIDNEQQEFLIWVGIISWYEAIYDLIK
jgi:hypothetical protein